MAAARAAARTASASWSEERARCDVGQWRCRFSLVRGATTTHFVPPARRACRLLFHVTALAAARGLVKPDAGAGAGAHNESTTYVVIS
jgi:hypothetical protein